MDNGDNGLSLAHAVSRVETDIKQEPENVTHLLQQTVEKNALVLIKKKNHALPQENVKPMVFGQTGQDTHHAV